jgi:transcriptional regulator with XRE-family HTH domain
MSNESTNLTDTDARGTATETFGQYMRRVREAQCLSLREVARTIGITASYLCDLELDRRKPPADPQIVSRWAEAIRADWGTAAGLALVGRADQWAGIVRDLFDIAAECYWLPVGPEDD